MRLRRAVIVIHRYLGIPLSVLFVLWFASGIVMMYTGGMPRLTPEERLSRLASLDLTRVALTPAAAAGRARLSPSPAQVVLLMVRGRPVYRFDGTTVFADTGERLAPLGVDAARTVVVDFTGTPEGAVEYVETLTDVDQWTLAYPREMPMYKFRVDDGAGTELYVSPRRGEVTVLTTRRSRILAWAGAIPHWFYVRSLRVHQLPWARAVVWSATLGCLLAILGLVLAVTQWRVRYAGLMRWHYLTGLGFGFVTLTWVFSGLLSMQPYAWMTTRGLDLPRDALAGGPLELGRYRAIDLDRWPPRVDRGDAKEIELLRIQDEPYYAVRTSAPPRELLMAAETMQLRDTPFSTDAMLARLTAAAPDVPVVETALLADYDAYYYSQDRSAPLPVLRVKFADPADTWYYVDPATSRVVRTEHRSTRLQRWLFNGLHSLDFSFWYHRRPLWDIGVILLSLGGLASSGIGLWLGVTRGWRGVARRLATPRSGPVTPPGG